MLLDDLIRLWLSRLGMLVLAAVLVVLMVQLRNGIEYIPPYPGRARVGFLTHMSGWTTSFSWAQYRASLSTYVQNLKAGELYYRPAYYTNHGTQTNFMPLLKTSWSRSFMLFSLATVTGAATGLLFGSLHAIRNRLVRGIGLACSVAGMAIPDFVAVVVGQYAAIWVLSTWGVRMWPVLASPDSLHGLLLPLLVLSLAPMGYVARLTASALDEIMAEDYIRTARSKGLSELRIITRHAFRNALPRILSGLPALLQITMVGLLVVEYLTNWPGMARWIIGEPMILFRQVTQTAVEPYVAGVTGDIVTTVGLCMVTWYLFMDTVITTLAMLFSPGTKGAGA